MDIAIEKNKMPVYSDLFGIWSGSCGKIRCLEGWLIGDLADSQM